MSVIEQPIEVPLDREALARRWRDLCDDVRFEDLAAKIELTEWGEILMSPVGKTHGLTAVRVASIVQRVLGGHAMVEVGIATAIGVRAPDVAWCSDAYLRAHPEDAPLSSAPELCIEIVSSSNALPKLREKAAAYVKAGATEAWLLFTQSKQVEVYGPEGRRQRSVFPVDHAELFA
jgi:Uma2 family endonuclease